MRNRLSVIGLAFLFQGAVVPYKEASEFEVKIAVEIRLKQLKFENYNTNIDLTETNGDRKKKQDNSGQLPFLLLKLKFLKLSDQEVKVRIRNAEEMTVYNKKTSAGKIIDLEMGFINDIKSGDVSREYHVVLSSANKKQVSRIEILIDKNGTYFVNEVPCGKF